MLQLPAGEAEVWLRVAEGVAGSVPVAHVVQSSRIVHPATLPCSCAYLRCANLQKGGGPAAGQGEGGWKCSACRVCWYW